VTNIASQSHAPSSHADLVEHRVQCVQSYMHFYESAAPSGSSRLQSSMTFGSRN